MSHTREIICHGLSHSDVRFFTAMLTLANRMLAQTWQVAPEVSPDTAVVLVDMDNPANEVFREMAARQYIVVAFASQPIPGMPWYLEKPVHNLNAVAALMRQIETHGDSAPPSESVPAEPTANFDYPAHTFAALLRDLIHAGECARLQVVGLPALYLDPNVHRFYFPAMSSQSLPSICRIFCANPRASIQRTTISPAELQHATEEFRAHTLDALLWTSALCAARDTLPVGINPKDPVGLRHWPNYTRLPHTPEHMTLAAFFQKNQVSPGVAAAELHLPLTVVLGFCDACRALGLLQAAPRASTVHRASLKTETVRFFGKIMQRLLGDTAPVIPPGGWRASPV